MADLRRGAEVPEGKEFREVEAAIRALAATNTLNGWGVSEFSGFYVDLVQKKAEVVGVPGKAFVTLVPGALPSERLAEELKNFVKEHLSAHTYPREVEFIDELPKTPSGKIQRFLLRTR